MFANLNKCKSRSLDFFFSNIYRHICFGFAIEKYWVHCIHCMCFLEVISKPIPLFSCSVISLLNMLTPSGRPVFVSVCMSVSESMTVSDNKLLPQPFVRFWKETKKLTKMWGESFFNFCKYIFNHITESFLKISFAALSRL